MLAYTANPNLCFTLILPLQFESTGGYRIKHVHIHPFSTKNTPIGNLLAFPLEVVKKNSFRYSWFLNFNAHLMVLIYHIQWHFTYVLVS